MSFRLGFDIGGTFTDFVIQNEKTGEVWLGKTLTTPKDPSIGVMNGLHALLAENGVDGSQIVQAVHATTLATNVVIERKGERIALLTTKGFRDILEFQRQKRYDLYDFYADKPVPLVPRHWILEVEERMAADGSVVRPLDEEQVRDLVRQLTARNVNSIAVSLLHSYRNPDHERRIEQIIKEESPQLPVSISSDVSPVIREYERTNTTVVNAYTMPAVREYLRRITAGLNEKGYFGHLYVMQSNGGIATSETVQKYPARIIESGPAAGALGAAHFGKIAGYTNLISFDMGGTTAKICLVEDSKPGMTNQFEIDRLQLKAGSGLVINVPAVDLIEIGAGGGSIAKVQMGMIAIGPESAGADPGPACYDIGGTDPTITDANLVLGYLNPDYFLGGKMKLNKEAAIKAIDERVANPLGLSVTQAAWGIHEIVTTNMARATRVVSIERGRDPRLFTLVAFGGAGPIHGARLARTIGVPRVIYPAGAGVASAIGLLVADVTFDLARTFIARIDENAIGPMKHIYGELEATALAMLEESKIKGQYTLVRSADMQYVGQGHEITVTLPPLTFTDADVVAIRKAFNDTYEGLYGYSDPGEAIMVVNWKLTASCATPKVASRNLQKVGNVEDALKGVRKAYFQETADYVDCRIYDRYKLFPGATLRGPAVIEERETAIMVLPGDVARMDEFDNIIVEVAVKEEIANA